MITTRPAIESFDMWGFYKHIGYEVAHPEVRRFHNSNARVKIVIAPRRTTKSYSAAKDALPDILRPGTTTWIVGPNYTLAEKEFRYIHEDLVIKGAGYGIPKPTSCMTAARSGQLRIEFPWGSIVEGKTADRPDSLLGEAVDLAIYSEAAQLPEYIRDRYVHPTLITRKGREIIPTTPDAKAEWLYKLDLRGQKGEIEGYESFTWDTTANPEYPQEELENARKIYGESSPVFQEQYLGKWVFYSGLVFNTFSPSYHIIESFEIPSNWPRYRGIDFGHKDPFVCLWMAVGPAGELYFYREYYNEDGPSTPEHAANIKALTGREQIYLTVADPQGAQLIEDLTFAGITCTSAENERAAGRLRVVEYLACTTENKPPFPRKDEPFHPERKWPKMYIFDNCEKLLNELKFYRWSESKAKEGLKEKTEGADHAVDTMRYLCMTRPSPIREITRTKHGSFDWHLKKSIDMRRFNIRASRHG